MVSRMGREERGQGLVEYALIIALVGLAAIVALGFLSGKINTLFSKAGNSLNNVPVAAGGGTVPPPQPPATGTPTTIPWDPPGPLGPFNIVYYYLGPGEAQGSLGSPDDREGFYTTFVTSPPGPTSFTVNGWTFNCTWHTPGVWTYSGTGDPFFSGCYN